jgi:hypothetical protein
VCTLLEVQHFQKLRLFYAAMSTDFSTTGVENVFQKRSHRAESEKQSTTASPVLGQWIGLGFATNF